jgi:hypothetical protein
MHITAIGYPREPTYADKKAAREFYEALTILIPCPFCREHYAQFVKENPITPALDSREALFEWTVKIHNLANKSMNKPEFTVMESLEVYDKMGARGISPIWSPADDEKFSLKSGLMGAGGTLAVVALLGGAYWYYKSTKE